MRDPQPRPVRVPSRRLALGLLVALAAACALAGCAADRAGRSATVEQPAADPSSASLAPPTAPDAAYREAVTTEIAAALQQDRARLAAELRSDPQPTLMTLAKPLGVAQDRLAEIVLTALDHAADAYGRARTWSAGQVAADKAYWASQAEGPLIAEVSRWLLAG